MKAKRCICGGKPQFVYYNIPLNHGADDSFEFNEDGVLEPMILFKRLECMDCGATVAQLVLTCDEAVDYWNAVRDGRRVLLQKRGTEPCGDVEVTGDA